MSGSEKPPRPWFMPDSAYNANQADEPAYFAIKQTAIKFHADLKSDSELQRRTHPRLTLDHFDNALKKVIAELVRNNRKRSDLVWETVAELSLVVAGLLIAPLITDLLAWIQPGGTFDTESVPVAIIGILLIIIKLLINNWR